MSKALSTSTASVSDVSQHIYTLRGVPVMFDIDLAEIYEVETRVLKRSVRAHIQRFPEDFMFEPTKEELQALRSKFWISNIENSFEPDIKRSLRSKIWISNAERPGRGGTRFTPFAFTEHGVAMLSSVLTSEKALQVNVAIVRAFIELRKTIPIVPSNSHAEYQSLRSDMNNLMQRFDKFESFLQKPLVASLPAASENRVEKILAAVANYWGLSAADLKSPARSKAISQARLIAIFFIRKHLGLGYSEIGRHFGQRDHTTILHAYRKAHVDSEDNDLVRVAIANLQGMLA